MKYLLLSAICLLTLLSLQTQAQRRMNGRILVVSGGGARGAWGAGYIKSLDSLYGGYRVVFGTSTGSLMAPLIVLGKFDALRTAYTSVTQQSIFNVNPFNNTTGSSSLNAWNAILRLICGKKTLGESKNLKKTMKQFLLPVDYDSIQHGRDSLEFVVSVVDFKTGGVGYKSSRQYGYDSMFNWIWASANEPLFMSYYQTADSGFYVDGGVRENIPLEQAVNYAEAHHIDTIDIVINKPVDPIIDKTYYPHNMLQGLTRLIELWETQVRNDNIRVAQYLSYLSDSLRNKVPDLQHTLTPQQEIVFNYHFFPAAYYAGYVNELVFDKAKMQVLWELGAQQVEDVNPTTTAMKAHPVKIHLSLLKQYLRPRL